MRIVSLFSGIGGLDIACERAFGGVTVTQVERDPFAVRLLARRWPDAVRHGDVITYRGEPCDVVCGGFPCTDLSVAGKRAGLDGEHSGLYRELLRIVSEAQPRYVVIENVPPLLKYRGRVDTDLAQLGYGTIWQVCEAADAGAPHRRQRVFIVAIRGLPGSQMLPRPSPQGDLFAPAFDGRGTDKKKWGTPRASMRDPSQDRCRGNLEDHVFSASRVLWPTPTTGDHATMYQQGGEPLWHAARWPTPTARDWKDSGHEPAAQARKWPGLPASVVMAGGGGGGVINPDWVDLLMGLPAGWTDIDADPDLGAHSWPAARGEDQRRGEPPILVAPKSVANRGARLKALGNAVVWQQAEPAIRRALAVAAARAGAAGAAAARAEVASWNRICDGVIAALECEQ